MSPKVTVMIANYNGSTYLPMCLDSVTQQTYKDFEALIIDDGSTDNSVDICTHYVKRDNRFRIIRLEKNRGHTYARHIGLLASKGEYVAIIDADDISLPHRLEKQTIYLDSHPETVLVGGYYGIFDEVGKIRRKKKKVPLTDLEIRWRLTFGNCLIHSTVMFRKEAAIKCGGYNPDTFRAQDMDIYTRLMSLGKVGAIPHVISLWRTHPKSITKTVPKDEYDRYCINIVKQSIQIHTHQNVSEDVAMALYYNIKNPSKDSESLIKSLDVLTNAFKSYSDIYKARAEKKILIGCMLKHLFKIRKKNKYTPWWTTCKKDWIDILRYLIAANEYKWYFDSGLFFPFFQFSFTNYLFLIQASMAGVFKQEKRSNITY